MASNFQTANPQYLDFMYKPPWELIDKVMATKQQQYDTAMASESVLNDMLNFNYITSEANKESAGYIKDRWESEINEIMSLIEQDPINVGSYMSRIDAISKEIYKDRQSGTMAKMEASYAARQKWLEDNKDKDPLTIQKGLAYFDRQWQEVGGDDINSQGWAGNTILDKIDRREIIASLKDLEANIKATAGVSASGGYIIENNGKIEEVSADRLYNYMLAQIMNPQDLASLAQEQQFEMAQYFDTETGQIDTDLSGWNWLKGIASAAAYTKEDFSKSMKSDDTFNSALNREAAMKREKFKIEAKERADSEAHLRKMKENLASAQTDEERDFWAQEIKSHIGAITAFVIPGGLTQDIASAVGSDDPMEKSRALSAFDNTITHEEMLIPSYMTDEQYRDVYKGYIDGKYESLDEAVQESFLNNLTPKQYAIDGIFGGDPTSKQLSDLNKVIRVIQPYMEHSDDIVKQRLFLSLNGEGDKLDIRDQRLKEIIDNPELRDIGKHYRNYYNSLSIAQGKNGDVAKSQIKRNKDIIISNYINPNKYSSAFQPKNAFRNSQMRGLSSTDIKTNLDKMNTTFSNQGTKNPVHFETIAREGSLQANELVKSNAKHFTIYDENRKELTPDEIKNINISEIGGVGNSSIMYSGKVIDDSGNSKRIYATVKGTSDLMFQPMRMVGLQHLKNNSSLRGVYTNIAEIQIESAFNKIRTKGLNSDSSPIRDPTGYTNFTITQSTDYFGNPTYFVYEGSEEAVRMKQKAAGSAYDFDPRNTARDPMRLRGTAQGTEELAEALLGFYLKELERNN